MATAVTGPATTAGLGDGDDNDLANYKYVRGANWTEENIKTLTSWTHRSAVMLDLTREATMYYRNILRRSTIINLIFSTVASTVSLSQFNDSVGGTSYLDTTLKAFFSVASILVALNTGYLKVYQIQERLESTIQLQHNWTLFGSKISSEIQLPVKLRKDALYMIIKMKETYHELIRDHVVINNDIIERVAIRNGISPQQLTITDLFERVIVDEYNRIKMEAGQTNDIIQVKIDTDGDGVSDAEGDAPARFRRIPDRHSTKFFENKDMRDLRKLDSATTEMRRKVSTLMSRTVTLPPKSQSYDGVMKELRTTAVRAPTTVGSPMSPTSAIPQSPGLQPQRPQAESKETASHSDNESINQPYSVSSEESHAQDKRL